MTDQGLNEQFSATAGQPKTETDPAARVVKRKLESELLALDRTPESYEAIVSFGNFALEKLNAPAQKLQDLKPVTEKAYQALLDAQGRLAEQLTGNGLEAITTEIARINAAETNGTASRQDRSRANDIRYNLSYQIDGLQSRASDVALVVYEARHLLQTKAETEKERTSGIAALSLYVDTAAEVLRRYDEEYIPQARKKFDLGGEPRDGRILNALYDRKQDFIERIEVLKEALEKQKAVTPGTSLETKYNEVNTYLKARRQEWKNLLEAAGVTKRPQVLQPAVQPR